MSGMMLAFTGGSYGAAPVNTVAPVVSGTATFGQTLTTTNGTWTGAPAPTFTYQWQRVTTDITGATSSTYVLVAADVGNTIRCVVKATNTIAPSGVTANSNSTASVAATVPGAPTIGTATQTGSTTATVAYTAPASNGGATITSYTATSSPGSITGTLSQAGSGTITVSGLTAGTAYTFTVYATNSVGNSASSSASNSITTAYMLGQSLGGGYYAGAISTSGNGIADYWLVVGPKASASSGTNYKQWQPYGTFSFTSATSVINGNTNSALINNANHPAAQFCKAVTAGGYSDWYLPAKNELEICYYNLKPTTNNNVTSVGTNPNAVPARSSNYTTSNPAQASSANVQNYGNWITNGSETFFNPSTESVAGYWSSTEVSTARAWRQYFNDGYQYSQYKNVYFRVRAVRRIAV